MMAVMEFDAGRRGRVITQFELCEYTRALATAVTEAMYYFIGHDEPGPNHSARYLSVSAAHIVHMLRDAREDARNGYFNIPGEYLQEHGISPWDADSQAYREWVYRRVRLAREYFQLGRECLAQVRNSRCRLAGYAYTARFEWMLNAIERDNYCLRSEYPERKSLPAAVWMGWSTLESMISSALIRYKPRNLVSQPIRIEE
jgi:phytoene/squalene synthetase